VVLRGSRREELVLRDEIAELVAARRGTLHELVGPRARVDLEGVLARHLPGRDVYVCGPDGFTAAVTATARAAGLPDDRIHHESFAF
jgi:ferredoxin-NADP reductase